MRTVRLTVNSSSDPDEAYRAISRYEDYPEFVEDISSIRVRQDEQELSVSTGQEITYSDWEVVFRNGPLRWTEVDYHQPAERRIAFEQLSGDFDVFQGRWLVEANAAGSRISFEVMFDFGIPSLAGVLEPIAERVLKQSIFTIMSRSVADVSPVVEDVESTPEVSKQPVAEHGFGEDSATAGSVTVR